MALKGKKLSKGMDYAMKKPKTTHMFRFHEPIVFSFIVQILYNTSVIYWYR